MEHSVKPESLALASLSLSSELISFLLKSGAIIPKDAKDIFSSAISSQRRMNTQANEEAARLLEEFEKSI